MKNYANGRDVLPEELFEEVKKHYTGILYISERIPPQDKRKLLIMLYEQKMDLKEIASIMGFSLRRVHQILAEERRKNTLLSGVEERIPLAGYNHAERVAKRSNAIINAITSILEERLPKQKAANNPNPKQSGSVNNNVL